MVLVNIFVYFVLPALIVGYFFIKKKYSYFADRNIPFVAPNSLIFGNLGDVGKTIHMADYMTKLYNELKDKGRVFGLFVSIVPNIVIADLELAKLVTIKDFSYFMDRKMYDNEEREPITANMFFTKGDRWKYLRNKLSPVFTSGKIKMMYHTISHKGEKLVQALEKASLDGSVDIKNIATRFTVDIFTSSAFGIEADTLVSDKNQIYLEILKNITGEGGVSQFRWTFLPMFPNLSKFFGLKFFGTKVNDFFVKIISKSIKYREDNNVIRKDFLNMLIEMKNKGSIEGEISTDLRKLTMDECYAQAFVFFLGGTDTSSSAIAYTMLEIGCRPEIQDKLRKEIVEKTKDSNGEITYDNLHEMTYLHQVCNETFRRYTTPYIWREAVADYKIPDSDIVIEKGTQVLVPSLSFHFDERYWKSPQDFNPDRFSSEESAKRPNMAYIPFGTGPRGCIGMRFGVVTTAYAVATIVKNFKATIDTTKTHLPLTLDIHTLFYEPVGGSWLNLEKV